MISVVRCFCVGGPHDPIVLQIVLVLEYRRSRPSLAVEKFQAKYSREDIESSTPATSGPG